MPPIDVLFYRDEDGRAPVLDWLDACHRRDPRIVAKCHARIERLESEGHALRRPEADYLRDGIYELRVRFGSVNYRILYFFHGQTAAILAHALAKEDAVPDRDLRLAVERSRLFAADPDRHTYVEEEG